MERFGEPGGSVHCAGRPVRPERFQRTSWEVFEARWRTQVQGAYNLAIHLLPPLLARRRGLLVFVVSAYAEGTC